MVRLYTKLKKTVKKSFKFEGFFDCGRFKISKKLVELLYKFYDSIFNVEL